GGGGRGHPVDPGITGQEPADGRRPRDSRGLRRGGLLPLRACVPVRHRHGPDHRRRLVCERGPAAKPARAWYDVMDDSAPESTSDDVPAQYLPAVRNTLDALEAAELAAAPGPQLRRHPHT